MKKIFTLLFALVATTTLWAHDFEVNGFFYTFLEGNDVEVTYKGSYNNNEYLSAVTIPETVTYNGTTYSVTSIRGWAFKDCSSLTSVTIPNSVTSIGYEAFEGCSALTSVTIPNSVTSIGYKAFYDCSSLTSIVVESGNTTYDSRENCNAIIETVTNTLIAGCQNTIIPNSVTSIGDGAFYDCSSLTSITIPNSVTSIGEEAFQYCDSLTSITIPYSVTSIGDKAFEGTGIYDDESNWENNVFYIDNYLIKAKYSISGSYTVKENTRSIADNAFYYCPSLTYVTIPNSVTSIGDGAFAGCVSLTSITIPNSVTSIGDGTFSGCVSLTSVTIPNSVTSIGDKAFSACESLTSITIPNSVTSIGDGAFEGTGIYDDESNLENNVLYIDNYLIKAKKSISGSYTVKENTRSIADFAFYCCRSLTSITIPNSVTSIGFGAFASCSSLTSVTIPNSVTSIGYGAFAGCESLTSITIPNSVTSIGNSAFERTGIYDDESNWENNVFYIDNYLIKAKKSISGSYTVKENTRSIADNAFYGCESLTSVTIPNSVTSIGDGTFAGCESLTSITIPSSVTSIGDTVFTSNLTSVVITAESIEEYCQSTVNELLYSKGIDLPRKLVIAGQELTELVIPCTVNTITEHTFKGLDFKSISISANTIEEYFSSSINQLLYDKGIQLPRKLMIAGKKANELVIPCTLTHIADNTFKGLDYNSITISANSVEEYCQSIVNELLYSKGIDLPRKLVIAGQELTELVIPCTVNTITEHTFKGLDFKSISISANTIEEYFSSSINQLLYDKGIQLPRKLMIAGKKANELIIPCTLPHIADNTFKGLDYNSITISANSVEEYCNSSINQLIYHKGVQLPRKLVIAGKEVTDLVIAEGVTEIKEEAFRGMQNIAVVTIPTSVNHIAKNAFVGTALYDNKANWVEGALYIGDCLIYVNTPLEKYDITEGTRLIADAAFEVCEGLTAVKLPRKSLLYIGTNAFSNCSLIKSVKLPKTVISVGEDAFSENTSVK